MKALPLEDTPDDIIRKALRSHGLSELSLPVSLPERRKFFHDKLNLDAEALEHLYAYHPEVRLPDGLNQYSFPFYDSGVNVWGLRLPDGIVFIDTGCTPGQMESILKQHSGEKNLAVLITHDHHDHTGGLVALGKNIPVISAHTLPASLASLQFFQTGSREWTSYPLPGHTEDSLGYAVLYNSQSLFFTGDALFAGSMGGLASPALYKPAMEYLERALDSLPDDTLILPGHGPATTIALEKEHNPFLKGRR